MSLAWPTISVIMDTASTMSLHAQYVPLIMGIAHTMTLTLHLFIINHSNLSPVFCYPHPISASDLPL